MRKIFCILFFVLPAFALFPQTRRFREVFPSCNTEQQKTAFSSEGYFYFGSKSERLTLLPHTGETLVVSKSNLGKNPDFFLEFLQIIPRKNVNLLSLYNSFQRIQDLKGRLFFSSTAKRYMPVFTDAVRLEAPDKTKSFLPDPSPAKMFPLRETAYVRVTDSRFGNCYFEVSLMSDKQGMLYRITNFKTMTFGPIPVVKERILNILLYVEPLEEGLAVYCLAGAEVSDFIARFVDIPTALFKRVDVFIEWMLDGLP